MNMRHQTRNRREKQIAPETSGKSGGIFTFRMLLICITALTIVVSLPLFTVWKQVYITNVALQNQRIADSLTILNREAVRLRLEAQKLGRTQRIEKIARQQLALRYPSSKEIVIVRPDKKKKNTFVMPKWRILAVLRNSLSQEKG